MRFLIGTLTDSDWQYDLCSTELSNALEEKIDEKFRKDDFTIAYIIRFTSPSYDPDYSRKPVIRYSKKDNSLLIDIKIKTEDYVGLYKIEKRLLLGKTFLEWLTKGLESTGLKKAQPEFNKEDFIAYVIELGKEIGWFVDEVDYSQDLEY